MKKALIFYTASATAALAHPGHEAAVADGAAHWLTQGDHLAVILAGAVFVWLAIDTRPLRALRRFLARE